MSYIRFGTDGSDVYVYHATDGVLVCSGCPFRVPVGWFAKRSEMINHLLEHQHAGHCVPAWVIENLFEEIKEMGDDVDTEKVGPHAVS
jgi:hypothetical protein